MTEYDAKIPEQHRKRAFKIRSTVKADGHEYKQYILDICQKMNDTVKDRILGAVGDLHAADARCHESCRASFISARNVKFCARASGSSTSKILRTTC